MAATTFPHSPSIGSEYDSDACITPSLSYSSSFPSSPSTGSESSFASPPLQAIPSFAKFASDVDPIEEEAAEDEFDLKKGEDFIRRYGNTKPNYSRHSSSGRPASIASSRAPTVLSVTGRGLAVSTPPLLSPSLAAN